MPSRTIVSPFSRAKVLLFCGAIFAFAACLWAAFPTASTYVGSRFSTETGNLLYLASLVIVTAAVPLAAWHFWNFIRLPAPLFIEDDCLVIYVLGVRRIPLAGITAVSEPQSIGISNSEIRLSTRDGRPVVFQTFLMKTAPAGVVSTLRGLIAPVAEAAGTATPPDGRP